MTPGQVDVTVVRRHLMALRSATRQLQRHRDVTVDELRTDRDLSWSIERGLQLAAQNALDIATHLVIAAGFDSTDYTTAIDRLVTIGAISAEFGANFRGIAGFRNILVHGYLEIDLDLVRKVLSERLRDFDQFASSIDGYLDRNA